MKKPVTTSVSVKRVEGKRSTISISWNSTIPGEDEKISAAIGRLLKSILNEEERDEFLVKLQAAKAESVGGGR